MQPYAYIELLLLDNFLVTLVLFLISSALLKIKLKKAFMLCSCTFSSVINLAIPYFNLSGFAMIIFKLSLGFVLCFICCINKTINQQLKFFLMFLLSTFLFGGIFFFSYYSFLLELGLSNIPVGFFALIVFILAKISFKLINKYFQPYFSDLSYSCEILIKNKKIKINAFLDTGNLLKDYDEKRSVVVIDILTLKQILTKKEIENLIKKDYLNLNLKNIHLLNYQTIEGKSKELTVFTPDKFIINLKYGKKEVDCLLGVSLLPLFKNQNFQAIISADIAQGALK